MPSFRSKRTVLFGDCDPAGAIYTPRIAHYVIEALLDFQASLLGGSAARELFAMGVLPPARSMHIDFLAPLTYDDELQLDVTCIEVGKSSFTCQVEARRRDNELAFRSRVVQVCVSPATKRPVELPERLRAALLADGAA
ncbi:MAG: acyl-CoA thioesterase [Burkholderiales bacterium]|nr:acyl-CoA thioesterase [Burkholderiales bacterium]